MGTGLAKAAIIKLDTAGNPVSTIQVLFNPKEYTIAKQNSWTSAKNPKTNVPEFEFSGGQPATLTMQLFFDTYAERKDVRTEYTDAICGLMAVDEQLVDRKSGKGRPPTVRFQWGTTIGFDAVITNINQRFSLFLPDNGMPVRAVLDVTFQQVKDASDKPPTNPTSMGIGGERVWTVQQGDTLAWIAFRVYGNCNQWRLIADANRLLNVRRLEPGFRLAVPNA